MAEATAEQARPTRTPPRGQPNWLLVGGLVGAGILLLKQQPAPTVPGLPVGQAPEQQVPAPSGGAAPSVPPSAPPGAPVNIRQSGATPYSVQLTWDIVQGAVAYDVYSYSPQLRLAEVYTNTATITNLQPNTNYQMFVVAIGADGQQSPPSAVITVTTSSTTQTPAVPSVPTLRTIQVTNTSAQFNWDQVPGADHYLLTNQTTGQTYGPFSGTSATVSGLQPGTSYQFYLQACNSVGCSGPSALETVTTQSTVQQGVLGTPGNVVATPGPDGTTVSITWSPVPGATAYEVDGSGTAGTFQGLTNSTSIQFSGLTPGATYSVQVYALSGSNRSQPGTATFTEPGVAPTQQQQPTLLPAPTNIREVASQATAPDQGTVTITWTPVTGAVSYHVYHVSDLSQPIAVTGAPQVTLSIHPGWLYTIVVRAVDAQGNEGQSSGPVTFIGPAYAGGAPAPTPGPTGPGTQPAGTPPAAPLGLHVVSTGTPGPGGVPVTIAWNPVPGAQRYDVLRMDNGAGLLSVTDTTAIIHLAPGQTLTIGVRAVNAYGSSSTSTLTVSAPAGGAQPAPPAGVTVGTPAQCTGTILRQGSTGPCVALAQTLLRQAGFNPGPVDGIFGPATYAAVRAFQSARRLSVDGVIGPQTWAALTGTATTSGPSGGATVVPVSLVIPAPTGLRVVNYGAPGPGGVPVTIAWNPVPGATSYRIGVNGPHITATSATSTVLHFAPGQRASVTVGAMVGGTWGPDSAPITVQVPSAPPVTTQPTPAPSPNTQQVLAQIAALGAQYRAYQQTHPGRDCHNDSYLASLHNQANALRRSIGQPESNVC